MIARCLFAVLVTIPMLTATASAAGTPEESFRSELRSELIAAEFTPEAADALLEADHDLDWESGKGADAALIAQALRRVDDEETELEPLDKALTALELARTVVELEAEGLADREIAVATLASVSELIARIQDWKTGSLENEDTNLGQIVRQTVSGNAEPALTQARERRRTEHGEPRVPGEAQPTTGARRGSREERAGSSNRGPSSRAR